MWTTGLVLAALYPLASIEKHCEKKIEKGGDLLKLLIGFGVIAAVEVAIVAAIRLVNAE